MCAPRMWGLKNLLPQIFAWGGITTFLVKKDFVKENITLRAQLQMLACYSQTANCTII